MSEAGCDKLFIFYTAEYKLFYFLNVWVNLILCVVYTGKNNAALTTEEHMHISFGIICEDFSTSL